VGKRVAGELHEERNAWGEQNKVCPHDEDMGKDGWAMTGAKSGEGMS